MIAHNIICKGHLLGTHERIEQNQCYVKCIYLEMAALTGFDLYMTILVVSEVAFRPPKNKAENMFSLQS